MRFALPAAMLFAALLAGCSLNYQAAELEASAAQEVPDTVAVGVTYRVVKDSRLSLELQAERTETYNTRKQTVISAAHFVEYDEKGERDTDGSADSVVFHTDTQDAEISGNVRVSSASEKGEISTESLSWQNKEKKLTADPDERVLVKKDDGTYISGRGFVGDFRIKEVRFTGPVEGVYVYEEK